MVIDTAQEPRVKRLIMFRALQYVKAMKKRAAEYEEACRDWAREGYRPHYCIHGTNQWTDYDNICGPCEEGLTLYQLALYSAHDDVRTFEQRMALYRAAVDLDAPQVVRDALSNWGCELITKAL